MIIALDYDDTYTRDPVMWNDFIGDALMRGHTVWCVSARHPVHMDDVEFTVGRLIGADQCIGTNGAAKSKFVWDNHGVYVDVWIDDNPRNVDTDFKFNHKDYEA